MTAFDPASLQAAKARLDGLRGGFFTSDLSIDEFTVLQQNGFRPLSMVMGSSVFHIGLQVARWSQSQELGVLTQAMHSARETALSRMVSEAQALGADGVVGTRAELQTYIGGEHELEFISVGTAVRYEHAPGSLALGPQRMPFTSALSGQDMVKIWRLGFTPVRFAFGVCVYHVAHQSLRQSLKQVGQNVEMPLYTQAVYDAREIALGRLQAEAQQWGGTGLVGTTLDVRSHLWGEHAVEFLATGTAIRPHGQEVTPLPAPTPVIGFNR
jgi:uncharacterized protein YbjQ (UPF0145 family)